MLNYYNTLYTVLTCIYSISVSHNASLLVWSTHNASVSSHNALLPLTGEYSILHTMPVIAPLLSVAAKSVISIREVHLPIWSLIWNDTKSSECRDKLYLSYSFQNGLYQFLPNYFFHHLELWAKLLIWLEKVETISSWYCIKHEHGSENYLNEHYVH